MGWPSRPLGLLLRGVIFSDYLSVTVLFPVINNTRTGDWTTWKMNIIVSELFPVTFVTSVGGYLGDKTKFKAASTVAQLCNEPNSQSVELRCLVFAWSNLLYFSYRKYGNFRRL